MTVPCQCQGQWHDLIRTVAVAFHCTQQESRVLHAQDLTNQHAGIPANLGYLQVP